LVSVGDLLQICASDGKSLLEVAPHCAIIQPTLHWPRMQHFRRPIIDIATWRIVFGLVVVDLETAEGVDPENTKRLDS
jgi:hypothetical protein